MGIVTAQQDVSSYYILGYYSSNEKMDGRFRRVKVRVRSRPKLKLDYRSGYFGPKEFRRFSSADKERQLEEALLLGDPITDLTLALEVNYFRLERDRYFVPVAVKIPGSELELARKRGHEQTRIDFIGQVRDERGKLMANLRDHVEVKLRGEDAAQLAGRRLQYDTGFTLPPGRYTMKFLTRENESGKIGTFETEFAIPDIDEQKDYARLSSVVWSNQREPLDAAVGVAERNKKLLALHPLVRDGQKLIPSITRVFRNDQSLYVYFEVYDPLTQGDARAPSVAASISFFRDGRKTFESEPLRVLALAPRRRRTVPAVAGFIVSSPTRPSHGATDQSSTQPLPPRTYHRPPQLVQPRPGRLVAAQPENALQTQRAGPVLLRGHVPDRPEPQPQRFARVLEDRAGGHRRLPPAAGAGDGFGGELGRGAGKATAETRAVSVARRA